MTNDAHANNSIDALARELDRLEQEIREREDQTAMLTKEKVRLELELKERDEREGAIWENIASRLGSRLSDLARLELELAEARQELKNTTQAFERLMEKSED